MLTFDDGPDFYTAEVMAELDELHLHGVFFDIGWKAAAHPELVRAEIDNGEVVGNLTWDNKSFTGKGVGVTNKPLTQAQVRAELSKADAAIVSAGSAPVSAAASSAPAALTALCAPGMLRDTLWACQAKREPPGVSVSSTAS